MFCASSVFQAKHLPLLYHPPHTPTEISTSRDKNFSCVDLIDTPGLVDGDMQVRQRPREGL